VLTPNVEKNKIQNQKINSKTKKGVLTKPLAKESLTSLWGRLCPLLKNPPLGFLILITTKQSACQFSITRIKFNSAAQILSFPRRRESMVALVDSRLRGNDGGVCVNDRSGRE
jgi:hypothetical protein